ncbi:MAG: hypothetical protein ACYSWZ_02365, partial [Planctomycetota bacterium]
MGTALQEIADSGLFATYDIPFSDAALSDLLNFSDPDTFVFSGLIDTLLIYDTGGNGIDEPGVVDPVPNDTNKLLKRIIDDKTGNGETEDDDVYLIPNFVTAQELAAKLDEILINMDLAGINANYDTSTNELTYDIELIGGERTTVTIDDALFEYDVDLSPFAKMTLYPATDPSDLVNLITGYTGLSMTFGIDLSPPGAAIYDELDLEKLNGGDGIDIKTERAVTGLDSVRAGLLSENAHFQVRIDGVLGWTLVTVDATDTENNYSYSDLAQDINVAIGETAAAGLVFAMYDASVDRLKLVAGPGETLRVYVWEYDDPEDYDTAFTELGFAMGYSVPGETVYALRSAPIGRLTGDAEFSIKVGTDDPVTVTVMESATASNYTISDLVADVDNALIAAGLGDLIKADYDVSGTQGKRLVLSAKDPGIEFTVIATNTKAQDELGLPNVETTANQYDFVIYDSSGGVHEIILDSLSGTSTVEELINLINNQIPGDDVVADFNATLTGLELYDKLGFDTSATDDQFRVETINGSRAILTLGFFSAGNEGTQNQFGNGNRYLIAGGPIGQTHLDDRFFVRDAELWGALRMKTPNTPDPGDPVMETPGAIGSALFGIVGVDTYLSGTQYVEFTADIKDPDTGVAGGTATLLELFEGAKQGRLTDDATFNVKIGSDPAVPITILKNDTLVDNERNNTLEDLVVDINEELELAGLSSDIEAQARGTRIVFVGKNDEVPAFTITASGTAISELGLKASDTSTPDEDGIQTISSAHAASRYAVDEPVVSEAFELAFGDYIAGEFTPGTMVYGWVDTDDNGIPDTLTGGEALIIDAEPGLLTLVHVKGTFASADWITNTANLLTSTIGAYGVGGEATQKTSFGEFDLHVDVQDGFAMEIDLVPTGFGSGFALLDGQSYDVEFALTDFGNPYDPSPPEATFDDLSGDTGDLHAFKDLGYTDIDVAFEDLLGILEEVNDQFSILTDPLPAIGKSVSELLNLVDGFEFGLQNLDEILAAANLALEPEGTDIPALTLQDIPNALRGAFGLPEGVDPDGVDSEGLPNVDWVKLDFDKANNMLLVDMSLNEAISTKLGLDINVGSGLANLTSAGVLIAEGDLDVNLSFGIDLAAPNDAYLFDDTSISGNLNIVGEGQTYAGGEDGMGLVFRASLGSLSVFIQDGDALIDVDFELPGLDFSGEAVPGQKLIRDVVWDDWNDPVTSWNVDIVLPMFYGGEGPNDYIDDFSATGNLVEGLTVTVPDFSDILDDIELGVLAYDPFDNILLAIDTLNLYLEGLSDILADEVLGIKMPFVGDQMADILFIESFRNTLYSTLKNGIENDIDPTPGDITSLLNTVIGGLLKENTTVTYDDNVGEGGTIYSDWYRQWDFTLAGEKTITLKDFDLGIPNLGFDLDVPVQVVLDWELDLGFGVNFDEVAYIDVSDANEIDLDLTITLPQVGTGMLGFLQFNVTGTDDTGAILNFDVDVVNENGGGDHLGFSDIGSVKPVALVTGDPLGNASDGDGDGDPDMLTLHLLTEAMWGLPELAADLVIDWALPVNTAVNSLEGNAVIPPKGLGIGVDYIALLNMEFDSGSVARSLLEPLFGTILEYIEPFMPVVDTLTAPIPVLSDLAGEPFTLLDLAGIFGDVNPDFIDAVADILDVLSIIGDSMATNILPLGDIVLFDTNSGIENFDPYDPDAKLSEIDLTLLTTDENDGDGLAVPLGEQPPLGEDPGDFDYTDQNNEFLKLVRSDPPLVKGLSMPIFTDPKQAIGLFLDQNAIMVDYKLPPLSVEFEYLQVFPVWGPLAVSIEISFGFTVDLHSVGFDTYGFQRYAKGGFRNPEVMFDGFYLNDLNDEGVDDPEVLFEFGLVGAAELNLGIARAGVGGGIKARIYLDWFDPIADGRVHISELIANVISADPGPNPLAVFDLGGSLTFQLFAFLEISLFGIEEEFPITPETELFSFEYTFDHDPILATDIGDGVLQLDMGPNAEDRIYGDTSDGHEKISLDYEGGEVKVYSSAFGVNKGSLVNTFTGINHIVGIGGQGNDIIELNLGTSDITYELEGGLGDDTIKVTGGGGGTIHGGVGNDTLTGGAGNDIIWGEEGNDTIDGGGGYDILFGDQGRYFDSESDPDPLITSRITGSDGDDTIYGGTEDDIIIGAGGDDTLNGDAGNDVIIGDGGRFAYLDVGGHFEISAVLPDSYNSYTPPGINDYVDPGVISDDIDEIHDDVLEIFHATDLGFGGNDTISGGEGGDLIFGGTADDLINGNAGDDLIFGGKGFDDIHGDANDDIIFGEDQADTISGNEGNDVISGGTGNDYIHGNAHNDVMKGDSGADVMFGDAGEDLVFGQTEPDVLMGGIDNDLVVGGTGSDIMFGDDGVVAKLDPSDGTGSKVIYNTIDFSEITIDNLLSDALSEEGNYYDGDIRTVDLIQTYVVAGDGNDYLSGNAGDDLMFGGGGDDTMGGDVDPRLETFDRPTEISEDVMIGDGGRITFDRRRYRSIATVIGSDTTGEPFNDTIYGDNGNDYILGGRGDDILAGGHGPDRGATDEEASDNDVIIGDNGGLLFADASLGSTPEEQKANFGRLTLIRTTDILNSTGGADTAYGEEGADVILGGVNNDDGLGEPEVDRLYGDYYDYTTAVPEITIGNDVILGDNGLLDFALGLDTDLDTLDLIHSEPYAVTDWSTEPPTLDDTTILGGTDIIDGSFGYDVLIGGVGGDTMYGDDETASNAEDDGEDIMLGDNADIFLIDNVGRLLVQVTDMPAGTAVDLITTTDIEDETGGADIMSGNAKADIMFGGVNNGGTDTMFGDRGGLNPEDQPTPASILNDGDDILVGDNGLLDFTFGGDESGEDRKTLDLIRSFEDTLGGRDVISGNKGLDVAIGGTGDDDIYGDDPNASAAADDLGDLLIGDNADIFLVPNGTDAGADLKLVLPLNLPTDAAVKSIYTTDTVDPDNTGGSDTISGNADADIVAGGVYGDTIYGDREFPNPTTEANEGDDIILGDNGAFEWLSDGRLSEITGIDISANNPALWAKYGTPVADEDLGTLDLVTTEQPTSGGRDLIYGDQGRDLVFAGTDADTIYGDDGDETGDAANNDLLFGDHGRIYPQFSTLREEGQDWRDAFNSRNFFAIDIDDADGGEGDRMWGEEGDDTMLGQQGDDRMWGGSEDDDMTGGHNVAGGYDELTAPAIDAVLNPVIGVPAIDAVNDLMDGGSGDDSMAGDNAIIWRRGDDFSPRFRELTEDAIYTTTADSITANIGEDWQSDPADAIGRDIELVDHSDAVQADPQGRFGADVMAGGADSDVMFGELANDLMQGDGSIGTSAVAIPFLSHEIGVDDSGITPPDTDEILYFNIPEAATDADDYMEGSGGDDLMYGGLGQDDMIGGSSELFGLTLEIMRPDGSDVIFGGVGIAIARNDIGATETEALASEDADHVITTAPDGHARDADFIMGDNANVYRLVDASIDEFLTFNYDDYGPLNIIPRAMEQLDYQLGGADYNGGEYINDAADPDGAGVIPADNGAADLIHGESGDDIIFGMTGSDLIFGEGQDDSIVGGYGHDWISGGTGQDGVLGDDGLIYTSRNSTIGEPLYGIAGLLAHDPRPKYADGNVLDEVIKTPGEIQYAVINLEGQLKKTVDLVPFSFDPTWIAMDDEFPDNQDALPYADDIIFGGLGTDWLHGGSGDDAISGAEALPEAYVPVYDGEGNPTGVLNLGYDAVALPSPVNPGDVLAFNPVDVDGWHTNNRLRAGEFALYDEYDPRRMILLTPTGELYKETGGVEGVDYFQFLLNFDETEGVVRPAGIVPKATGQQTENYPAVNDDGKDAIFGDLGNDWLVGGTGRDNIYGGWGNDLLNADDDHDGHDNLNNLNEETDTHPYYEDRAYGGAGRDVLIGNTGGDRLIDWVGEYNSYLVPYAPFGMASVSRTMQPFLPDFLYALSAGDGADPTRPGDTGADVLRNGEPDAEMGLVLQKDFAWQAQTGAPADPQAGNIPGGPRDVLRSATFNDETTQGFSADVGLWKVAYGRYYVEPEVLGGEALSVWHHDQTVPSYFELTATVSPAKPIAGYKANAYILFDYYSDEDFKFVGLNSSTNKIEIGQRTADGWEVLIFANMQIKDGQNYNLLLALNGTTATIVVNNGDALSYSFAPRIDVYGLPHNLNEGMVGLGANNAKAAMDNINIRVIPPQITLTATDEFDVDPKLVGGETGTWTLVVSEYMRAVRQVFDASTEDQYTQDAILDSYFVGEPENGQTLALAIGELTVGPAYLLQLETTFSTATTAGVVFDQYDVDDFKWAAYSKTTNQVMIGHYTARDGWVIDNAVSYQTKGKATLKVTLKGSTVSVMINDQPAVSHVFNAIVTDGKFGLIAKDGSASFDMFTVCTDDPSFVVETETDNLMASAAPGETSGVTITDADLAPIVTEAIDRWENVLGVDSTLLAALYDMNYQVVDFDGLVLGQTMPDTIFIDADAAGYGWFVDETPE